MYYKQTTDKLTPSPLRRCSQFSIPNTYFSTLKQPLERQSETFELKYDRLKDFEQLQLQIDTLKDENMKLRSSIKQLQILQQSKDQEIQQSTNKIICLQRESQQLRALLNEKNFENSKLLQYVEDLSQKFCLLQNDYQDALLQLQQRDINENSMSLLEKELKGKQEEIEILKGELQRSSRQESQNTDSEENYRIFNFLQNVKQQYYDDQQSECISMQDFNFQ